MAAILDSTNIGRMATIDADGYPYITPVNFVYHEGCIYFHCAAKGEKLDNLARDSRVCFEVDLPLAYLEVAFNEEKSPCNTHQFYHSVVIRGRARVVPDGPLKIEALNALVAKHEGHRDFRAVTADMADAKACRVVEITPERMTGKSDLAQNKPQDGRRREIAEHLAARGRDGDLTAVRAMGYEPIGDGENGYKIK
jgi:hypothetical protein